MKILKKQDFQKRIREDVEKLSTIAFKDKWRMYYDGDMDVWYYASPKLSEKHVLFPINEKNMSIRVGYNGKIDGVVIDNFWSFFAKENPEFYDFARRMIKTTLPNYVEIKKDSKESNSTKALIHEFCKTVLLKPQLLTC